MATTITYKGSDLTSFSNTSKTLRTAGKYLEGDITITAGLDINNQNKTVIPSEASQSITADTGYTGLGTVTVNGITNTYVGSSVPQKEIGDVSITYSNNQINVNLPAGYYNLGGTKVIQPPNILPTQRSTTIIPSETDQTAVDIHKWTTGTVTVAAITPTYVGSEVPQRTNADLSLHTGSVTGPSGYYSSNLQKSFPVAGNAPQPTITVNSSGLITSKVTVPMDAWYQVSSKTSTLQLPVQASTTITPSSATQTITGQKYMTGDITIQPIPSQYIVPSGTLTITSVDTTTTFNATSYASVAVNLKNADVTAY